MADLRVTLLVENTAGRRGLLGEHGLALWIERGDTHILFDTGQGEVLLHNASQLDIDLATADAIVLSHGHYDHTGGLAGALETLGRTIPLYAHPAAFEPKYARNPDGTGRAIGIPAADARAANDLADLRWVDRPTEIGGGITLTGPVPRTTDFEDTGGAFFTDAACTTGDPLTDDQAAFVDTPAGTVALLGCAHAGVINTLRTIRRLTGGRPIHAVLGGMHLLNASPERMDRTIAELDLLDIPRLLPCHCTGPAAVARLRREWPDRCEACPTGTVVTFDGCT
ncbi:MAG: MBL fold metallo-hydrolase [Planctomycetota bacterium]